MSEQQLEQMLARLRGLRDKTADQSKRSDMIPTEGYGVPQAGRSAEESAEHVEHTSTGQHVPLQNNYGFIDLTSEENFANGPTPQAAKLWSIPNTQPDQQPGADAIQVQRSDQALNGKTGSSALDPGPEPEPGVSYPSKSRQHQVPVTTTVTAGGDQTGQQPLSDFIDRLNLIKQQQRQQQQQQRQQQQQAQQHRQQQQQAAPGSGVAGGGAARQELVEGVVRRYLSGQSRQQEVAGAGGKLAQQGERTFGSAAGDALDSHPPASRGSETRQQLEMVRQLLRDRQALNQGGSSLSALQHSWTQQAAGEGPPGQLSSDPQERARSHVQSGVAPPQQQHSQWQQQQKTQWQDQGWRLEGSTPMEGPGVQEPSGRGTMQPRSHPMQAQQVGAAPSQQHFDPWAAHHWAQQQQERQLPASLRHPTSEPHLPHHHGSNHTNHQQQQQQLEAWQWRQQGQGERWPLHHVNHESPTLDHSQYSHHHHQQQQQQPRGLPSSLARDPASGSVFGPHTGAIRSQPSPQSWPLGNTVTTGGGHTGTQVPASRGVAATGGYPPYFNPMLAARPVEGEEVAGWDPGMQSEHPSSFASDLASAARLLGSGAASTAVAIQRGLTSAVGGVASLGRRLPLSLGGMGSVTGVGGGAGQQPGSALYHPAYAPPPGALPAPGPPALSGRPPAGPAASADSKAALKAVMDGLQTAGTKDEMEAAEGSLLVPLMRHQKLALAWMSKREGGCTQPIGGILADDQGLGKTVSTIALIVTNRPDARKQGSPSGEGQDRAASTTKRRRARSISEASMAQQAQQLQRTPGARQVPATSAAQSGDTSAPGSEGGAPPHVTSGESDSDSAGQPSSGDEEGNGGGSGTGEQGEGGREEEVIELDLSDTEEVAQKLEPSPTKFTLQGGTLVVCPTTVLHQWASEIRGKTSQQAGVTVHTYHGRGKHCSPDTLSRYTVVLTTYATLALEAPTKGAPTKRRKAEGGRSASKGSLPELEEAAERGRGTEWEDDVIDLAADVKRGGVIGSGEEAGAVPPALPPDPAKKRRRGGDPATREKGGPLYQIMWHRVVLDEAQCIKNRSTLAAHAAWCLKARRRWCLSGTPMQNSVDDLYSYFRFLKYEPYSRPTHFKEWIKDAIATSPAVGYKRLHAILQGVVLRRTKQSTIGGQPIVNLPERRQRLEQRSFSPSEDDFYKKLQAEAADKMEAFKAEGTVRQNYVSILWMLLRLRQACNHPWLVKGSKHGYHHHHASPASSEVQAARKLPSDLRSQLSATLQEQLTVCVVCGDLPEDPLVSVCNHVCCAQCVAPRISMAGHGAAEAELAYHCPACGHALGKHNVFSAEALAAAQQAQQQGPPDAKPSQEGGGEADPGDRKGGWQSSAKIDALMELLRGLRDRDGGEGKEGGEAKRSVLTAARSLSHSRLAAALKRSSAMGKGGGGAKGASSEVARHLAEKVIVFSQWTAMLDLVEVPLKKDSFKFRRLDGSMSIQQRQAAIHDFTHSPDIGIILVSLKAASLGVNLVSANHVVLLDLWWNPTVEEQAIDRAHRIGQTKPVYVTRITIAGTVEERILELQNKKRELVASAFGEEGGAGGLAANRLTMEDLQYLFQPIGARR